MLEVWVPLLLCVAVAAAWYHVLRLRERAVAHARRLCERHGLQLLDDSVSLRRWRPRWWRGSLQLRREYRFETSLGGNDRQPASMTLLDNRVVGSSLPSRERFADFHAPATTSHAPPGESHRAAVSSNVIPIERAHRTLH